MKGDCNICINGKMPSYSATCMECGLSRKNYKPITNADRIRSMADEELAEMMFKMQRYGDCPDGDDDAFCKKGDCYQCWLDWLKQEVKDDNS